EHREQSDRKNGTEHGGTLPEVEVPFRAILRGSAGHGFIMTPRRQSDPRQKNAVAGWTAALTADVVIMGAGVIGLSTTLELARSGLSCVLLSSDEPGAASGAAAGLLAPSVGRLSRAAKHFFQGSLRWYRDFIAPLCELDPDLQLLEGLVEVRERD